MGRLCRIQARIRTRRRRAVDGLQPPSLFARSVFARPFATVSALIAISAMAYGILAFGARPHGTSVGGVGGAVAYGTTAGGTVAYGPSAGSAVAYGPSVGGAAPYGISGLEGMEFGETDAADDSLTAADVTVVAIDHSRSAYDIAKMAKANKHTGLTPISSASDTPYERQPSFKYPFEAGSLRDDDIEDAQNALRMVRYIAGLPYEDISFTAELNSISQHGAVFMAATSFFGHDINDYLGRLGKPQGITDTFLSLARYGCAKGNISAGINNISVGVMAFVSDGLPRNIERAGHRRWILRPGGSEFGIGFAYNAKSDDIYGGYRIAMYVQDDKPVFGCVPDTFVAWPSAGDFPIQYFIGSEDLSSVPVYPWTVNLGAGYMEPRREDMKIYIRRTRAGVSDTMWMIDKSTPLLGESNYSDDLQHLAVDNGRYGMGKAIVFRPDAARLGSIKDGDVFTVKIGGLKTAEGIATTLEYEVRFFDLNRAMSMVPSEKAATAATPATPTPKAAATATTKTAATPKPTATSKAAAKADTAAAAKPTATPKAATKTAATPKVTVTAATPKATTTPKAAAAATPKPAAKLGVAPTPKLAANAAAATTP